MCGIVGYIGGKEAFPIIIKGLKRLEYRGYDSAGVALLNGDLNVYKKAGKVSDLENHADGKNLTGNIGIGHTRWATHGEPNDVNAHPHISGDGNIVVIHNGIIENYAVLKEILTSRGHVFNSDTDTEVLVHLIEEIRNKNDYSLEKAVRIALTEVVGAYAIVVMSKDNPDKLVAARKSSPLVVGIGDDEFFLASDATPIVEYTNNVVYLNDEEVAVVHRNGEFTIRTLENVQKTPFIQELQMKLEQLEKGGYEHFMLKEIYEQPTSVYDSYRGRFSVERNYIQLGGVKEYEQRFVNAKRMIIVACGTSWHAGLVAEYLIEDLTRIPVEVEYASEFRYRNPIINEDDIVIAISQSGETADTLAALDLAKKKGALTFGICNVVGSSIARVTDAGAYTHAGPEIGVASTKAFTAQLTVLSLLAMHVGAKKGTLSTRDWHKFASELERIPEKVKKALETNDLVYEISEKFKDATNFLYLGRGVNFPVALEGALKLKEISYIHAEGYPAAEMKHGPIALIDENMPVVVIATNQSAQEKIISNIQEVKARKGVVIAVVNEGDTSVNGIADYVVEVPETLEVFTPLVATIPLQLLSYHIAVMRGCDVDQPRNLAKSVTVE
ncbi:MAG: glutamine--fructose-6-phosphate transaminase (isomerizing) [Saprospiraceae bacterium]|nr:glutamine--fructose-6-phosphate transaminase (isomerizing) [Saprospiraceae bacterium]